MDDSVERSHDHHAMKHLGADLPDNERLEHLRRSAPERPGASLPDPFEPLIALWQQGYRLDRLPSGDAVLIPPAPR